jgi:CheY-like chemotaxis protein
MGTSIDRGLHKVTVTEVPLGNLPSDVTRYRIYLPTTSEVSPIAFLAGSDCAEPIHSGLKQYLGTVMKRRKATILCIDDHWQGLIGRKMLLEKNGYEVLEANRCDEALKLFASRDVDAVVVDYQMPGMSGDLIAEKMKRINSHVPIMLLSAYGPLPKNKLRSVDSFMTKSQPANAMLLALQGLLSDQHKPFFSRWLDQWKNRNQVSS